MNITLLNHIINRQSSSLLNHFTFSQLHKNNSNVSYIPQYNYFNTNHVFIPTNKSNLKNISVRSEDSRHHWGGGGRGTVYRAVDRSHQLQASRNGWDAKTDLSGSCLQPHSFEGKFCLPETDTLVENLFQNGKEYYCIN